jgi:hypothetical protein
VFYKFRLIRHDLILVRNAGASLFATASDKIIFGSIAVLFLTIGYTALFSYLKSNNPQAWAVTLGFNVVLAVAVSSLAATRLRYFSEQSVLYRDTLRQSHQRQYAAALHCLALMGTLPTVYGLLSYQTAFGFFQRPVFLALAYGLGFIAYPLLHRIYSFLGFIFQNRSQTYIVSPQRVNSSQKRIRRLAELVLIKQVPFARRRRSAVSIIFAAVIFSLAVAYFASFGQNEIVQLGFVASVTAIFLLLFFRVDYKLLRFAASIGYRPMESILCHVIAGFMYSLGFGIALMVSTGPNAFNKLIPILGVWMLGAFVLGVYICSLRLYSKRKASFLFQAEFTLSIILSTLNPILGLIFLLLRWGYIIFKAQKQQWLLP